MTALVMGEYECEGTHAVGDADEADEAVADEVSQHVCAAGSAPTPSQPSRPARKAAASKKAAAKPKLARKRTTDNAAGASDEQQETDKRTLKRQQSDSCWTQAKKHDNAKEARQVKANEALADLRSLNIPELSPEPNFSKKKLKMHRTSSCLCVCVTMQCVHSWGY